MNANSTLSHITGSPFQGHGHLRFDSRVTGVLTAFAQSFRSRHEGTIHRVFMTLNKLKGSAGA